MKKSMGKLSLILALAMATSTVIAGCSKAKTEQPASGSGTDTKALSSVKLKMYLLGDKPKDYDTVYGEISKQMQQKINATLDVNFIAWGDLSTKYSYYSLQGKILI
jgi:putative aldouronate transport system substrate-binding protein